MSKKNKQKDEIIQGQHNDYTKPEEYKILRKKTIKELIAPICSIAIISALAYGFSKEKNKSFMHIASSVTIAKIPVVIAEIVGLLTLVGSKITTVTIPFAGFCGILSIVLLFFTLKDIVGEKENKNIFWKFALIMGIYYAIEIVLSFLKIYI